MAIFDFHFHLLFKHAISNDPNQDLNGDIKVGGLTQILNKVFGGPFESQSSPRMVLASPLHFGVIGLIAIEHAFVNNMLHFLGFHLDQALPIDQQMIADIRDGKKNYHELFNKQLAFTLNAITQQEPNWNFHLLNRSDPAKRQRAITALADYIKDPSKNTGERWFALSMEGGHNLCEVPIKHPTEIHQTPDLTLRALMQRKDMDLISINLCHLSYIKEQNLGGFAQGLNKTANLAFNSPDFKPNPSGAGLTPLGRKVIREALLNKSKPVLIDVKHMSLYTRIQYYRYKNKLAEEFPHVNKLPVISSHTGFTFIPYMEYIEKQQYTPKLETVDGNLQTSIRPLERKIGKTDDLVNKGIFCNPWTISLFDEEIVEIFRSGGMIGISLDQRVLGTERMVADSRRNDKEYEEEYLSRDEYIKLFQNRQLPEAEGIAEIFRRILPSAAERHSMLLALHIVHAVRVGLDAGISDPDDSESSPWDFICIGSDFDGLINPINAVQDVTQMDKLRTELIKYLPQADKTLPFYPDEKALRYDSNNRVDRNYMEQMIDKVLVRNGVKFLQRFINNWGI